jgi:hypothetical protein
LRKKGAKFAREIKINRPDSMREDMQRMPRSVVNSQQERLWT